MNYPDPVAEEAAYTLERERRWDEWVRTLPNCEICDEPLTGEYYDLNGTKVCKTCMDSYLFKGDPDISSCIENLIYPLRRKTT